VRVWLTCATAVLAAALFPATGVAQSDVEQSGNRPFMITVLAHRVSWHSVPGGWDHASVMPRDWPHGYASNDPGVIADINKQMSDAGIWSMSSWWGWEQGKSFGGDVFMDAFLSVPGPPTAVLYEATGRLKNNLELKGIPEGKGGEDYDFSEPFNADTFVNDMVYLHSKYFTGAHADRFLRIDGRPIVFIWVSHAFTGPFDAVMARVRAQVPVYLIGSDFSVPAHFREGIEHVVPAMDAISSYGGYDPNQFGLEMDGKYIAAFRGALAQWRGWLAANTHGVKIMPPMIFNYDERLIPGRHGYHFHASLDVARQYAQEVRNAIADPCQTGILPMTFIVSYDECYEGTCIIPSIEYQSQYQDMVHEVFKDPVIITREQRQGCFSHDNPRR